MIARMHDARNQAGRRPAGRFVLVGLLLLHSALTGSVKAADRLMLTDGSDIDGEITSLAPNDVAIETKSGSGSEKISIAAILDVRFDDEPEGLSTARSLLRRGDGKGALAELGKINAIELQEGVVGPRVRQEHEYLMAAAKALAAAPDEAAAARAALATYLDRNARSHHVYAGRQLLGNLLADAGDTAGAAAAYQVLDGGPPALRIRSARLRADLLASQGKHAEATRAFEAAMTIPLPEKAADGPAAERKSASLALAAAASERRAAALGRARSMAKSGKATDAITVVRGVIREADPADRDLLAAAYGTLGECQRTAGDATTDALISYLTVDLVYNQVPAWHAQALYNLAELWEATNQPERGRQAAGTLKTIYPESPWTKKLPGGKDDT